MTAQSLPPITSDELMTRYRQIIAAILFGSAESPSGQPPVQP